MIKHKRSRSPLQSLARFINRLWRPSLKYYTVEELYAEQVKRRVTEGLTDLSLKDYDTEELVAELEARGWSVREP